jgi:hypothetical protein
MLLGVDVVQCILSTRKAGSKLGLALDRRIAVYHKYDETCPIQVAELGIRHSPDGYEKGYEPNLGVKMSNFEDRPACRMSVPIKIHVFSRTKNVAKGSEVGVVAHSSHRMRFSMQLRVHEKVMDLPYEAEIKQIGQRWACM